MAEQNQPLTDALNPPPKDDSVSPLFNKMDALMARHRRPASPHHEDIPVLTDIAPEAFDIPILTDVINNEDLIQKIENIERSLAEAQSAKARRKLEEKLASENELAIPSLMFAPSTPAQNSAESSAKSSRAAISEPIAALDLELTPPRISTTARTPATIEQPVFLDLPLLDLNAIEAAPIIPTGKAATLTDSNSASDFNFVADDLIIDFSTPIEAEAAISTELNIDEFSNDELHRHDDHIEALSLETSQLEPSAFESISLESSNDHLGSVDLEIHLDPEPATQAVSSLQSGIIDEPVPNTAPSLHWEDDEHISISLNCVDEEPHLEITLDEIDNEAGINSEPLFKNIPVDIPAASIIAEAKTEAETEAAPEQASEAEVIETSLNADAIAELTAVVGAQLAVDIASEVEQLARQHFSKLMAQFYGDTLRELTSEISRELEERLAPRIVELVEQELISKGLIQK